MPGNAYTGAWSWSSNFTASRTLKRCSILSIPPNEYAMKFISIFDGDSSGNSSEIVTNTIGMAVFIQAILLRGSKPTTVEDSWENSLSQIQQSAQPAVTSGTKRSRIRSAISKPTPMFGSDGRGGPPVHGGAITASRSNLKISANRIRPISPLCRFFKISFRECRNSYLRRLNSNSQPDRVSCINRRGPQIC